MSFSPDGNTYLNDTLIAPLKRNHACLNCKKRKTRCCGTRPVCNPCMRSHAHAVRSAKKNNALPPALCCEWADEEDESDSKPAPNTSEGKKRPQKEKIKGSLAGKAFEREKEKRRDEEKEILLARIAELESRLASLSPSAPAQEKGFPSMSMSDYSTPTEARSVRATMEDCTLPQPAETNGGQTTAWLNDISRNGAEQMNTSANANTMAYDFAGLFMVPANWPQGLPSPFLLNHLIEVFFSHTPQLPRMIHRSNFLTRLRLPPTDPNFPHASLLHAICAFAAPFTAWVNNLAPNALEASVEQHKKMYGNLESIEDFGLAQAELSQKSIRLSTQACMTGPGPMILEVCQASIILSDLYFQKGMPLQGWIIAGTAPRLLKALEFLSKNRRSPHHESMAGEAKDSHEREERLATVWMAFIFDAGFTLNSYWNGGFELDEIWCALPVDAEAFARNEQCYLGNPQTAHSPDVWIHHPLPDPFVLTAKASMLVSRSAKWIRHWSQRDISPGDEMEGLRQPSFHALVNDIHAFRVPGAMRSIIKAFEQAPNSAIDANVILLHVLPNIALCVIYEPFVDWHSPQQSNALTNVQQGYEGVMRILHLIPSNLDLSLVATSLTILCLYTCGRLVANLVQRNMDLQQYDTAARHRADLQHIQCLLSRYGQKHALGQVMVDYLDCYSAAIQNGQFKTRGQICASQMRGDFQNMSSPTSPEVISSKRLRSESGRQSTSTLADGVCVPDEHKRWYDTSTDSAGPTPPGPNASGSGSSGAPTPNDLLDFSHYVDIIDSSASDTFFMPPMSGVVDLSGHIYDKKTMMEFFRPGDGFTSQKKGEMVSTQAGQDVGADKAVAWTSW